MATETKTFDLSTISNAKGSATYGFTYSGGVLTPANKGKDSTYAYAKLTFEMPANGTLTLGVTQSSEKNFDFGLVSNLDSSLSYDTSVDSSVKYNAKGLDGSTTITYDNVTKGSHFITVKYKKDGSANNGSDAFNITSLVATYEAAVEGVTTFDLSTLELAEGTYDITVVAKADGYKDSAESEAVSYEVTAEDALAGTWVLNDVISAPTENFGFNLDFSMTDGVRTIYSSSAYNYLYLQKTAFFAFLAPVTSQGYSSETQPRFCYVANKQSYNGWYYTSGGVATSDLVSSSPPSITITTHSSEVTNGDVLLAWLQANATKQ